MSKKIYINPGHSEKDPGAVGYATERQLNEKVSGFMADYLQTHYDCQIRVYSSDSLNAVCDDANLWSADLFVSNHFNAGGGDGFEALVYSEKTVPLGQSFAKHVEAAGQNLRLYGIAPGVKVRPNLHVLKYTHMSAVLTEGAFVDNRQDIKDWDEEHELQKLGIAYAKAAAEYLVLPPKTAEEPLQIFLRQLVSALGVEEAAIFDHTVTVSAKKNATHPVVRPIQTYLHALGYSQVGEADGIAGRKFDGAVRAFQRDHGCVTDGEITARNKTWRCLLGME